MDNTQKRGLDTTGGYKFTVGFSYFNQALGSDLDYGVFELDASYYYSIVEDHILLFRLKADLADGDVPILFDLAGRKNLRGVSNDDFEGTERWISTIEYRFPIYRDINFYLLGLLKDIRGFVFFEIGSATTEIITRSSDYDEMELVQAAGLGVRFDYFFLEHFPLPLMIQFGKRLDNSDSPIFYVSASKNF